MLEKINTKSRTVIFLFSTEFLGLLWWRFWYIYDGVFFRKFSPKSLFICICRSRHRRCSIKIGVLKGITKPCTHSTQLHLPPPTSTQLHPPPASSYQSQTSSLQNHKRYCNQNIALNLAISPNLGQKKFQSCPFDWKLAHMVFWKCRFRIRT